ncbi:MAG: peptidoglycan-binding domain-containing protein [Candidatus Acidiferrales bacterium]
MTKLSITASLLLTLAATLCVTTTRAVIAPAPQQATTSTTKKKSSKKHHSSKREPTQKAPTPERISEIQSALAHNGYYQGNPTGKWDSNTISAMQKFQSDNGLSNSGKIDAPSLQKLGLGSGTAGVDAPKPITPKLAASAPAASATSPTPPAASTTSASSATPTPNSSPTPKPQR